MADEQRHKKFFEVRIMPITTQDRVTKKNKTSIVLLRDIDRQKTVYLLLPNDE